MINRRDFNFKFFKNLPLMLLILCGFGLSSISRFEGELNRECDYEVYFIKVPKWYNLKAMDEMRVDMESKFEKKKFLFFRMDGYNNVEIVVAKDLNGGDYESIVKELRKDFLKIK